MKFKRRFVLYILISRAILTTAGKRLQASIAKGIDVLPLVGYNILKDTLDIRRGKTGVFKYIEQVPFLPLRMLDTFARFRANQRIFLHMGKRLA